MNNSTSVILVVAIAALFIFSTLWEGGDVVANCPPNGVITVGWEGISRIETCTYFNAK